MDFMETYGTFGLINRKLTLTRAQKSRQYFLNHILLRKNLPVSAALSLPHCIQGIHTISMPFMVNMHNQELRL